MTLLTLHDLGNWRKARIHFLFTLACSQTAFHIAFRITNPSTAIRITGADTVWIQAIETPVENISLVNKSTKLMDFAVVVATTFNHIEWFNSACLFDVVVDITAINCWSESGS